VLLSIQVHDRPVFFLGQPALKETALSSIPGSGSLSVRFPLAVGIRLHPGAVARLLHLPVNYPDQLNTGLFQPISHL
jgi:hypothetical protein